ncbi:hypothetical protein D3C84_990500 [compost metagenome]
MKDTNAPKNDCTITPANISVSIAITPLERASANTANSVAAPVAKATTGIVHRPNND